MRKSRKDAADSRARVLRSASEIFRAQGYDGVGIAALMQAAGLTNGAFYKQFASKEALIAEATAAALEENLKAWEPVLATGRDPLADWAAWYLAAQDLDRRDKGCALATLAAEAPRHEDPVRQAFAEGLERMLDRLEAAGADQTEAIRLLSRLVGALTLARAVADPDLSARIVAANLTPGS